VITREMRDLLIDPMLCHMVQIVLVTYVYMYYHIEILDILRLLGDIG
jgi:hypothetical protein